ncbi:MAG: hypothetical protein E2O45_01410 [Nitrospina sp.]|nr:MAG: hypothetical protein E2O45_01410 [Nitrospina sp.]
MPEIKDHGKVWMRGKPGTSFAVKVDDRVFVLGQEEGQSIDYWLEGNFLCVDLHEPDRSLRIARRFPLDLEATHPATLFNGFDRTQHADVQVVTFEDKGVEEKVFRDEDYRKRNLESLSRQAFWRQAGFNS